MKKNAIFINTGRGPTVTESALIKALQEKWIAGAGLDVLQVEPAKPDNPLLKMPHVILSPHNASASARFDPAPQAPRRPGAGAGAVGALADVVRQPHRAAGKRPAPLAAGVDGARPELVSAWSGIRKSKSGYQRRLHCDRRVAAFDARAARPG